MKHIDVLCPSIEHMPMLESFYEFGRLGHRRRACVRHGKPQIVAVINEGPFLTGVAVSADVQQNPELRRHSGFLETIMNRKNDATKTLHSAPLPTLACLHD